MKSKEMKHLVLFAFMVTTAFVADSQTIYQTAASGNYSDNATWVGGAAGKPLATMNSPACDCKIVINAGHTLTVNQNLSLTNAFFVLKGASPKLTLSSNGRNIILNGTSGIDIQTTSGSIIRGQNNQFIRINTTTVWTDDFEFQSTTNGTVQGVASVHTANTTWSGAALPVKLSNFDVSKDAKGISLVWSTATEVNSAHFEIEKSSDSKMWSAIGRVIAGGNTGVEKKYSYTDVSPFDGANYYRLKMVDADAKFEYSPIKSVNFSSTSLSVVVGPNPASSFLNIRVNAPGGEPYRVRLINRSGQIVLDQKYAAAGSQQQLNIVNFADGSYFLEVTKGSSLKQITKIMIVRK
jgi:hypothetical protein